ncbi:unnamed protein product [Strongylus vulgaris]|uniref:Uncharacterized protein n=1 Tax=Strongylus vulgaris TaxID=40348 RepID=A0A3P7IDC0_STRVU|nr:unnamed protein product [Strongylus vulgaris]
MPIAKSVMKRCLDKIFDVEDNEDEGDMVTAPSQSLLSTPGSAVRSSPAPTVHNYVESRKVVSQFGESIQSSESKVNVGLEEKFSQPPYHITWGFLQRR